MKSRNGPASGFDRLLVRDIDSWAFFEAFLVAAVSSFLGVRLLLQLTGYPQLGGHGLHIAHMLWGGLLMLVAIVILLGLLSRAARRAGAIVGGLGFGLFIDELGKFVTSDNNYFYRPAVSVIYIVFVAVYLLIHTFRTGRIYTPYEYLVNALHQMEEVAMNDVSEGERARALYYLDRSDPGHPLVPVLRRVLSDAALVPEPRDSRLARLRRFLVSRYRSLATKPSFIRGVMLLFIARLVLAVGFPLILAIGAMIYPGEAIDLGFIGRIPLRLTALRFSDAALLISSVAGGLFTLLGVALLRKSRRRAFEMFERSLLVSIFVTRVFVFYREQFLALGGLAADLLLLIAVRFIVEQERVHTPRDARTGVSDFGQPQPEGTG